MRIKSINVTGRPPIARFEVQDLSDRIVIAGPNGVGKTKLLQYIQEVARNPVGQSPDTRLTIEATSTAERDAWGKSQIDTADQEDASRLLTTLQHNRYRRNLESSFVVFESSRSIQQIKPLTFAFEMPDPEKEEVSWDFGFQQWTNRYQDVVHSIFRMLEAQRRRLGSRALQLRREGKDRMNLRFEDPLQDFRQIFRTLLPNKEFADPDLNSQRLRYREDGELRDFESLSSGEREVVTVAFDFQLRNPKDCVVLFDEPELHLHPELTSRFLLALQQIGSRNQFLFTTHSPDLISASLDDSVVFLSAAKEAPESGEENQAIPMLEADETNKALRLLGHSLGLISLGRKIVLIEGETSSTDKLTYESLVNSLGQDLVLMPAGGRQSISSFELINREILSKSLWGVNFFMIVDGDTVGALHAAPSDRLKRLNKYHIENYFLDAATWSKVFEPIEPDDSWLRNPEEIEKKFLEFARETVPYAVALRVSNTVRENVGNVSLMPKDVHGKNLAELSDAFRNRIADESTRLAPHLDEKAVLKLVKTEFQELDDLIAKGDMKWKELLPGRPVLKRFLAAAGVNAGHARRMYLQFAEGSSSDPFAEIKEYLTAFADYQDQ